MVVTPPFGFVATAAARLEPHAHWAATGCEAAPAPEAGSFSGGAEAVGATNVAAKGESSLDPQGAVQVVLDERETAEIASMAAHRPAEGDAAALPFR